MKKIFALVIIAVLAMLSLASCFGGNGGGGKNDPCEKGHTFTTYISNNDATCTEDGTKTAKCANCDATDTVVDTGSCVGHIFDLWQTVKNATCTADGEEKRLCTVCHFSETRAVGEKGHSYNTEVFGYQGEDGHAHRCIDCGEKDTVVAHTPGAEATEDTAQKCTECEYVIAPPLGHTCSFILEVANEVTLLTPANCTDAAVYRKSCSCGTVSTDPDEVFSYGTANGHDLADATCTAPATCKDCPYTEGEANGHDFGDDDDWYVFMPAGPATKGEERRDCKNCDQYESRETEPTENIDPDGWTKL